VASALALSFAKDWKDIFLYANEDDDLVLVNFTASNPDCHGANYSIPWKQGGCQISYKMYMRGNSL